MKKLSILIIGLLFIMSLQGLAFAESNSINVFLNSKTVKLDQPPVVKNNRTLVPLRGILESLGATVVWDAKSKSINVTKGDLTITLKVGSKLAKVKAKNVTLDQSAEVINNRTLVPLRFLSESIGATVKWEAKTNRIYLVQDVENNSKVTPTKTTTPTKVAPSKTTKPVTDVSNAISDVKITYDSLITNVKVRVDNSIEKVKCNGTEMRYLGNNEYERNLVSIKLGSIITISVYNDSNKLILAKKYTAQ